MLDFYRNTLGRTVNDNYVPLPHIDDSAWAVKDSLLISSGKGRVLWMLSYEELLTRNADSAPPPKCVRKKGILISSFR